MIDHDADDADDTKDDDLTIQGERSILRGASPAFPSDGSCTPKQEWNHTPCLQEKRYSRKTLKMGERSTSKKEKDLQCQNFSLGQLLLLTESLFELRVVIDHSWDLYDRYQSDVTQKEIIPIIYLISYLMPFWYKLIPGSSRLQAPQKLIFLRPFKDGVISHPNHPLILFHHSYFVDFFTP